VTGRGERAGIRADLAELAAGRPIYVAARVVDYDRPSMPEAECWLRRALPGAQLTFARGRFRDTAHWLESWAREREDFGGLVLATWSPLHAIGLGMTRELADMLRLGRPVAWLRLAAAANRGTGNGWLSAALVDRFRISASPAETLDDAGRIKATQWAKPWAPRVVRRVLDLAAGAEFRAPRPSPPHRPLPLPGSCADLAARAGGRPIYVTAQFALARSVLDEALELLRRDMPGAEIIAARGLYEDLFADWHSRWPIERTLYGGAVVVTAGKPAELPDPLPADLLSKPLPFRGGHDIPSAVAAEIAAFVEMRRPVAWLAFEAPLPPYLVAWRWLPRFAVDELPRWRPHPTLSGVRRMEMISDAGAYLYPAIHAEDFAPVISGFRPVRREPWTRPKVVASRPSPAPER
jgi:hypothetical protein